MVHFVGRKIGKLLVTGICTWGSYSKMQYYCKCECGTICVRSHATLQNAITHGRTSSCGCWQTQFLTHGDSERCRKAGQHRKDAFQNGCNIQMTFRDGTIASNTTGYQGVSWSGTAHKWHAYIGYNKYRANLGFYEDIKDAVKIRKMAEEALKENRFEDFFYELRGFRIEEKCKQSEKRRK